MSGDTMKCPKCGLPQPSRHVFCARCDATLRISGAAAAEAIALAKSLSELDVEASAGLPEPPPAPRPLAEGPAWVAPRSSADQNWGVPERPPRRRRATNPGVPREPTSSRALAAAPPPPPLSADSLPATPEPDRKPHGRPPGALYASENPVPQGDPLMAALLEGIHSEEMEAVPGPGPQDADSRTGPPTSPGAPSARVVAPSRGRKASASGLRSDPRGRQAGALPDEPSGRRSNNSDHARRGEGRPVGRTSGRAIPRSASVGASSMRDAKVVDPLGDRVKEDVARRSGTYATRPAALSSVRTTSLEAPEDSGGRRGVAIVAMLLTLAVAGVAANAGLQRIGHVRAIEGVLNAGIGPNGPVPVLPKDLDRVLDERDLGPHVVSRTHRILGATETFAVGVELEQRVLGLPLVYQVKAEGDADIRRMLATMDFYRDGGWELDARAQERLAEYKAKKQAVTPEVEVPELEEDSRATLPSSGAEGEEGEETPAEGAPPAP